MVQSLGNVFQDYQLTRASGAKVPAGNPSPDLAAIRETIPEFFKMLLGKVGRDPEDYYVYGGVGPTNFNFARIPWVAICDRKVSSGAQYGYYIVLLFTEDLDGCFLSLNQGYTQYKDAFGTDSLALKQIARTAGACAYFLNPGAPFQAGPIDLGASLSMGRGYETGAIVSRYYAQADVSELILEEDFQVLLEMYERLVGRVGANILAFSPPVSEDEFQAAAASAASARVSEPPPGSLPPPPFEGAATGGRFRRDPNMAGLALVAAAYSCEVDQRHTTFTCQRTRQNFVEAHHLFPMGAQADFSVSLDVPENIVSLCPTCHRRLHHGLRSEVRQVLKVLWAKRRVALSARGINDSLAVLLSCYREKLVDGD